MRPVLHGDVSAAACALLALAPCCRPRALAAMLAEADAADLFRKRTGRAHPRWGNGSLMAAALGHKRAPEPFLDQPDYAACMALVFEALVRRG